MPPVIIQVTVATLAGVLNTISNLAGGPNGSNVTDFNDKRVNALPTLPGPYNVGVTPVVFHDYDHHQFPLCDIGNYEGSHVDCLRPRQIIASLFYPSCPPPVDQVELVALDEEHFAPVFTPTVLGEISHTAASTADSDFAGLHNLMSQAVSSAPACIGQRPLTIFAPDAGGQRQAYTQVASELASMGHVVLTVDSPFLSGVVEYPPRTVQRSLFGGVADTHDAFVIQSSDLRFVHEQLATVNEALSRVSSGTNGTSVQLDHCIFGHGSGGRIAQAMVDTHVVKCGGRLEGILTLPAPFNRQNKVTKPQPPAGSHPSTFPSPSPDVLQPHPPDFSPFLLEIFRVLKHLRGSGISLLKELICRLEGTCDTQSRSDSRSIEKRNVADDPWYFPEYPYHKKPYYDDGYGYGDHKDEYGHDCYDDKWYGDCDDHYGYDYDCDDHYGYGYDCDDHYGYEYDPCDDYDRPYYPPYYPPQPYPSDPYPPYPYPSRPFPPPGIFPPNMTWPPYGNLPYGNTPWDDHWDDYPNSGFPYRPKYGHKYCDHYYGGYPYGYEDYGNDLDCDGYPDHYREWDKKKYCHGWVDDHCDHDDDDYDDNDCEDYDEDCDDDYDHEDCEKEHHHHGDVDDHDDGHDEHDDHGYVDNWDEEDRA